MAYSRTQPVSPITSSACPAPATATVTNQITVTVSAEGDVDSNLDALTSLTASYASIQSSASGKFVGNDLPRTTDTIVNSPVAQSASTPNPSNQYEAEPTVASSLPRASNGTTPSSTVLSQASLSQTSSTIASLPTTSSSTRPANASKEGFDGQFWAGACIGTLMAMEAMKGRVFYDYDGKTVKDPVKTLGDAGVNAVRMSSIRNLEQNFKLDFGCIDIQVKTAQRAVTEGMRIVLTINQGLKIPKALESLSYPQMVDDVKKEAKRQLQPYLDVGILPDIILLENEGTDGFLFEEESTGHQRGTKGGNVPSSEVDDERCGKKPTGKMDSYAQHTGYLKAEINACNDAIVAVGLATDTVRYGLHSHGQYVQWKEAVVHGSDPGDQTTLKDASGKVCGEGVIPADLLKQDIRTMLNIAGFSPDPDPMTPTDINSASAQEATLDRLDRTLTQLQGYAEQHGRFTDGPFAGQWKLQGFGVEYATSFTADQIPQEQALTEMMWEKAKGFDAFLGMMWWEPWYVYNNWEGGRATLARKIESVDVHGEAPTDALRIWGKAAVSPWMD